MKKFWKHCFTGRDNKTADIGRVLMFEAVQAYILISLYMIYKGQSIDIMLWGAGLASLIGAGGASLGLKAATEPESFAVTTAAGVTIKQSIGRQQQGSDDDDSDPVTPAPPPMEH